MDERLSQRCAVGTLVLTVHAALLGWSATRHSPTFNEIGHLPAGISHWRYRMFHLYRVNPPLPRMVATLPLLFGDVETDWSNYGLSPFSRDEIPMGIRFAKANGPQTFRIFTIARWACIPFCLLGGWICFRWAWELWGSAAAWLALLLWCTNPFILGHGAVVMPDVPAAALGLAATYLFWKWLKQPTWRRAAAAGAVLGLAELSKTTLVVLFVLWPALWGLCGLAQQRGRQRESRLRQAGMLAAALCLAVYVMNLGYGFAGSFQRLADFQFQSRLFIGERGDDSKRGNRFRDTWLGAIPLPLPKDYVQGIDRQRADFEEGDRSYLRGEWKEGGWWYYHLYGLAVKTPLGTLLLLGAGVYASCCRQGYGCAWRDELCLLLPAAAVISLVSSQTGFSNHVRYTIPALPFLFVWISKAGLSFARRDRIVASLACLCVAWSVGSSLWVYPHSLSYFNELAGGPRNGHRHLLDSNVAWGQDLPCLRRWLDEHPEADPLHLAAFGWVDPRLAGIEFRLPPVGPDRPGIAGPEVEDVRQLGPRPGWYAIDVNFLHATHWPAANGSGGWKEIAPSGLNYTYFRHFKAVDVVGYSIFIYHLSLFDCNRLRRELGLPFIDLDPKNTEGDRNSEKVVRPRPAGRDANGQQSKCALARIRLCCSVVGRRCTSCDGAEGCAR